MITDLYQNSSFLWLFALLKNDRFLIENPVFFHNLPALLVLTPSELNTQLVEISIHSFVKGILSTNLPIQNFYLTENNPRVVTILLE